MNPIIGLSLGRIVVGLLFFFRPDLAGRLMGQDVQETPELALGARLRAAPSIDSEKLVTCCLAAAR